MIEYTYNIFGLIIRSQLEIPELISTQSKQAHVTVQFGSTPEHLNEIISSGVLYESTEKEFLLSLPNIGNYLVRNGDEVIIDPKSGASEDEIRLFLLGSVLGALLYQRGYMPLHGSAVEIAGKAALVADPKKPKEIEEKILEIFSNSSTRIRLIRQGGKRVKEFSWEKTAKETIKVYKSVDSKQ